MTNEEWHIFFHREHRWTEHTKVRKIAAPPPTPPPKGRGVITEIPMWGGCRLLFASLLVSTIAETLCVLCMPKAFCVLEMCAKRLSELCALCEKKTPQRISSVLSHMEGAFYFSQKNTDEQNTQRSTETLSQPISQNLTANLSWKASVTSVCRRPSVCSKRAPKSSVNSVRSVREKTPQRISSVISHMEGAFYFSQKNTDEQNTQRSER